MLGDGAVVVYLGLGSNQGDRLEHLRAALGDLRQEHVQPVRASRVYAGPYLGPGPPQPEYLNAVVEARTALGPLALLAAAAAVEARHGRRAGTHGRPRPLDVDLLLYGGWRIRHPRLVVPHPRLAERRFVLEPLCELGVDSAPLVPELPARLAALRRLQQLDVLAEPLATGATHDARA
jgi:2-amino-4-hydroxy-6-hydroxymethyldihydropteridine diphosphokinase